MITKDDVMEIVLQEYSFCCRDITHMMCCPKSKAIFMCRLAMDLVCMGLY